MENSSPDREETQGYTEAKQSGSKHKTQIITAENAEGF
jgi:hypothetical protein